MPAYDYQCAACGRRFEVIHGVHADGPTSCPLCGNGPVRKAITAAAVHYRGSGWAKKERRTPVAAGASKAGDDASGDGGSGQDAGTKAEGGTKPDGGKTETPRDGAAKKKTGAAETGSSSKGG
jgi:putative FmdB family regulatory protein